MRHTPTSVSHKGFTLVEVLIVAPIVLLFIGTFIGLIVANTGDSLRLRQKNATTYTTQAALDDIELSIGRASLFPTQTRYASTPQGKFDDGTQFQNTLENGSNTLIIESAATTNNPYNLNRTIIHRGVGACNASNPVSLYTTVYFVRLDPVSNTRSLFKRTILDPAPACSVPWQRPSCSVSSVDANTHPTRCRARDELMVRNVSSMVLVYYDSSGAVLTQAQSASATSVRVSLSTSQTVAGETQQYSASLLASSNNSGEANTDIGQAETQDPSITFERSSSTPYRTDFAWDTIGNASNYNVEFRVDGGAWQQGPQNTTQTTYSHNLLARNQSVTLRVTAATSGGSFTYAPVTSTIPAWHDCPYSGDWETYPAWPSARFTRTSSNVIALNGLIRNGTAGSTSIVCTLPEGFRPDERLIFQASTFGTTVGRIDIDTNGNVLAIGGSPTWLNLGSITFVRNGGITWTPLNGSNGWVNYGSPYSPAKVGKDMFGRAHIQGLVRNGVSSPAGTVAFALPSGYTQSAADIYGAMGGGVAFSLMQVSVTPAITTRNTGAANSYWSLQSMFYPSSVSGWSSPTFQNGWVNYSSGYSPAGYIKSNDDIVSLRGMIRSGTTTSGTIAFTLPSGFRPSENVMCDIGSNNTYSRLDVTPSGSVIVREGTNNGWLSLAGCDFPADQ